MEDKRNQPNPSSGERQKGRVENDENPREEKASGESSKAKPGQAVRDDQASDDPFERRDSGDRNLSADDSETGGSLY